MREPIGEVSDRAVILVSGRGTSAVIRKVDQ